MTAQEIESCLRDFNATHKTAPMLLIAGDLIFSSLYESRAFAADGLTLYFAGVKVMHDPLIKGIVVSS